jgi:hypothetical protein
MIVVYIRQPNSSVFSEASMLNIQVYLFWYFLSPSDSESGLSRIMSSIFYHCVTVIYGFS